jgi:potassium efflux system protein
VKGGRCRFVAALLIAASAYAQGDPFAAPDVALAEARARLKELGDAASEEAKAVGRRIQLLEELKRTEGERKALPSIREIEARRAEAQRGIDALKGRPAPTEVRLASPEAASEYDRRLAEARTARDVKQVEVEAGAARRIEADAERKALPAREGDAKRRLSDVENKEDELARYIADNARLELRVVRERSALVGEAEPVRAALAPVLDLELDLARLRFDFAEREQKLAATEAARLREAEAKTIRDAAEAEARAAELTVNPVERFRLERSAEAAGIRAENAAIQSHISEIETANREQEDLLRFAAQERATLEKRLARGDEGTADLLRGVRDRARRARQLARARLDDAYAKAAANQKLLVSVLDRLWLLELPPSDNEELQALLVELPEEQREHARRVFADAVHGSGGVVAALRAKRTSLERVETLLGEHTALLVEHEAEIDRFLVFVEDRILWVRSEPPADADLLPEAAREIARLASLRFGLWFQVGAARLAAAGGALAMIVLLYFAARRLQAKAAAPPAAPGWRAVAGRTLLGLVGAALPAAGFFGASLALQALKLPSTIDEPLPATLAFIAAVVLIRRCAAFLLRDGGLVVATLGFPATVAKQILRSVGLITIAALVLRVPSIVLATAPYRAKALPRLIDPAWYAVLGFALLLLLRRRGAIVQDLTRPGSWIRGAWGLAWLGTALLTIASISLDILGYRVGASFLVVNMARTAVLLVLIAGIYSTLLALVGRIATRVRSRTMQAEGVAVAWQLSATVVDQLSRLVAATVAVVAALLFLRFWGLSGGIARALGSVPVIHLADGGSVTLLNVATAFLWVLGGHFVVRNLSAVYDAVVSPLLRQTDAAGRYVFLALSRYAILLVAYGSALLSLQVSFASIGWLLAAISFGVCFGLQEIVANFVSGLILLLERPIRVGDLIEVDGEVAVVERINIRSTTVTNFERQTIIIPNKQLITQNLTNWTRNDRLMRRQFRVGVAYGSDVEKVLRVLDEEVRRHPKVLRDPAHAIRFAQFGESSLDFDVFFFAVIDDGVDALADLHRQVYERFAKEKIEIPFPQRDLHLRSGGEHLDRDGGDRRGGPASP